MAKNSGFRQDKPHSGVLGKLYLTSRQRRIVAKWVCYALVLVMLSVLQDVIFSQMRIFGATTDLVPCGIFLICIFEGVHTGSVFALSAAVAYLFSDPGVGIYAMVLVVAVAVFFSIFREAYLQKGFGATMLCTAAAMFTYETAVFLIGLFLHQTYWQRIVGFLITATLSQLAAPLLYPMVSVIGKIGGDIWRE